MYLRKAPASTKNKNLRCEIMESLKNNNAVFYSYRIVNFLWYMLILMSVIALSFMVTHSFSINIPLSTEQVTLVGDINPEMMEIDEAQASIKAEYILQNHPTIYVGMLFATPFVIAFFLYGVYQLRMILKSAVDDMVFHEKNIKRLRIIGIMFLISAPLEWLGYILLVRPLNESLNSFSISISTDLSGIDSFVVGFLILALSVVFEKGHDIYQELKLTV